MNQQEAPTGVVGYTEAPKYQWSRTVLRGQPWYEVVVRIPERARKPSWPYWMFHAEGMTPWEGAQVAALEVLTTICYQKREEMEATSMRLFPAVALSDPLVYHHNGSYAAFKMMEMAKDSACTQAQERLEETKVQAEQVIGLEHQVTELQMQHQADQNRIKELEHQLTNAHSKLKNLSQQQEEICLYAVAVREDLKETMSFISHQEQAIKELNRAHPMEFQVAQRLVNHLQQAVHRLNAAFYPTPASAD
jgi:hypothetical protein